MSSASVFTRPMMGRTMDNRNPLKLEDRGDGPAQIGRMADDVPHFDRSNIDTYLFVADQDSKPTRGDPVLILDGVLWAPDPGDEIWLGEPNREATVRAQRYEVINGRLSSAVYVRDPATAKP